MVCLDLISQNKDERDNNFNVSEKIEEDIAN